MRIGCSRCQAQYDLPDEKLERGAAKIRCKQCGHVFVVKRRNVAPPPSPAAAGRFDELDFGFSPAPEGGKPPLQAPVGTTDFGDFDLGALDTPAEPEQRTVPSPATGDLGEFDLGSIDFSQSAEAPEASREPASAFGDGARGSADEVSRDEPSLPRKEASFDDFQFDSFEMPGEDEVAEKKSDELPRRGEKKGEDEDFFSSGGDLPSLGELDLGEFDDGAGAGFDEPRGSSPSRDGASEPIERVRKEDLVSPGQSHREVPLQGLAEDLPRLDLQRGPRRSESVGTPSPLLPRDRRRSPLFWIVIAAVLVTGGYTGYNAYLHPEAFTAFNPQRIRELWRNRDVEAKFATEDVKGYGQDLPGGRRVFVIRGRVVNKSGSAQGLIRVKGNLFGRDGTTLAAGEVYCGNLLNDRELAVLPRATIEARLQNQVGEALSNVDVAPGGKVPFMLVFPAPSARVENFNVLVSAWRGGGS